MKKKLNTDDLNLTDAESEKTDSQENDFVSERKMKKVTTIYIIVSVIFVISAIIALFYNQINSYVENLICCESYGSSIWNECHNLKVFGSDYCKEHICALAECKNEKYRDFDYSYCKEHNCSFWLMPDGEHCYNYADGGGKYCSEHTCSKANCTNAIYKEERYCMGHLF